MSSEDRDIDDQFECIGVWANQSRKCPLCSAEMAPFLLHDLDSITPTKVRLLLCADYPAGLTSSSTSLPFLNSSYPLHRNPKLALHDRQAQDGRNTEKKWMSWITK